MISISSVNSDNLPDLAQLLRAIAVDESPDDPHATDEAKANLAASLFEEFQPIFCQKTVPSIADVA